MPHNRSLERKREEAMRSTVEDWPGYFLTIRCPEYWPSEVESCVTSDAHSLNKKEAATEAAAEFREETSKRAASSQVPVAAVLILHARCSRDKQECCNAA